MVGLRPLFTSPVWAWEGVLENFFNLCCKPLETFGFYQCLGLRPRSKDDDDDQCQF